MFGDKQFPNIGFPTPDDIPLETGCRQFSIPASTAWFAVVMGCLMLLAEEENWQQFEGGISVETAAEVAQEIIDSGYASAPCPAALAPYWQDEDGGDAGGEGDSDTWYNELSYFVIEAFLATMISPPAAITFTTAIRELRLAFLRNGFGGIVDVLLDDVFQFAVDTYAAGTPVLNISLDTGDDLPHTLKLVNTGTANPAAVVDPAYGEYTIGVIRKNLRAYIPEDGEMLVKDLRQTAGQLEVQYAGDDTWYDVPNADNVRRDGSTIMTDGLDIEPSTDQYALDAHGDGSLPVAVRLRSDIDAQSDWSIWVDDIAGWFSIKNNNTGAAPFSIIPNVNAETKLLLNTSFPRWRRTNATNDALREVLQFSRMGGNNPAAGYGIGFYFSANVVAGTVDKSLAGIYAQLDVAGAAYRSSMLMRINDDAGTRTALQLGTNGAAATLGALGATPISRQMITGSRNGNDALASLLAALEAFGFITDASTIGVDIIYDPGTDKVQVTYDGETYYDAPQFDPRTINQFDPNGELCDAAANIIAALQYIVDALIDALQGGAAAADLGALIILWLAVFAGFAILLALAVAVGAVLFSIGYTDLYTAFSSFDWDDLLCWLRCNLNEDGRLTEETLSDMQTYITTTYSATIANTLNGIVSVTGLGGLNAFAATGEETGDCSECDTCEWEHGIYPLRPENPTETGYYTQVCECDGTDCRQAGILGAIGERDGLPSFEETVVNGVHRGLAIRMSKYIPPSATITSISLVWVQVSGNSDNYVKRITVNGDCSSWLGAFNNSPRVKSVSISGEMMQLELAMELNANSSVLYVPYILFNGTGIDPF